MKKKMDLNFSYAICQYFIWKKSSCDFFATFTSTDCSINGKKNGLEFLRCYLLIWKKSSGEFFLRLLLPPSWFGRKEVVRSFFATFFPRTASCLAVVWLLGSLLTEEIVPCCSGNRAVNANMPPGLLRYTNKHGDQRPWINHPKRKWRGCGSHTDTDFGFFRIFMGIHWDFWGIFGILWIFWGANHF